MSLTRRSLLYGATAAASPIGALAAQPWPARTIRMLVGTAPGGSPDIVARILAEKLADRLGVSVVVENITQAAGAVAYETVSRSPPDGYTMGILTAGFPPQAVLRRKTLVYDPVGGFAFVTMLCGYPMVYAVAPGSPIASFRDLIDRAKAAPGRLTYTINAPGSIYHVLTKWIELEAGITMTPVSYRGTAQALTDVLAGRVDLMVDAATSAFPRVQSGQLRLLALSAPSRYALMPQAPIVADTVPGIAFMSWLGLAMALATPAPIVARLNQEIRAALALPDVTKRLAEGGNVATPSTPGEMREKVAGDIARWARVIDAAGIKTE
ncbi:MAG TPA: tripartite tricarboxylate transporter substrate-binding protein [Xanthobacteraceae bacterium]|nr:tripartite tricarboxylate transporter substrate-binding protein [Xanthobacteraceae bacterium]